MANVARLSMSLEPQLAEGLDRLVENAGYSNRSEYLRNMIRERLVEEQWADDQEVLGTITLLYDHHQHGLSNKLHSLQHKHHAHVLAATHLHLDHHTCAETIMVRGEPRLLRELVQGMQKLKGVWHATLSTSTTGEGIK